MTTVRQVLKNQWGVPFKNMMCPEKLRDWKMRTIDPRASSDSNFGGI